MLFIVCALNCEAKPLITHFGLQLMENASSFSIYTNSSIYLIITGVGKIQTAAAMGYVQGLVSNPKHSVWFNIGIAGHASWALGTGILAHQIVDQASGRSGYPTFVIDRPVATASIWTVDQPETAYEGEGVYDMEASAFWSIASRFTTAELIHCYKVISDNRQTGTSYLTKIQVEGLISAHLNSIESLILALQKLSNSLSSLELSAEEIAPFLKQWHFTSTQQCQLKRLLQSWKACTKQPVSTLWNENLLNLSKANQVLLYLAEQKKLLSLLPQLK